MKYLITILFFSLLALPALAYERPLDFVRPRLGDTPPALPIPPPIPPLPISPVVPEIPEIPVVPEINPLDCINCSGGGTSVMTYPRQRGQFWAKRGSLIVPRYNFGNYIRYKFFFALDDGNGGQWFSKGTFYKVGW